MDERRSAWDDWSAGESSMEDAFFDYLDAKKDCLTGLLRGVGIVIFTILAARRFRAER